MTEEWDKKEYDKFIHDLADLRDKVVLKEDHYMYGWDQMCSCPLSVVYFAGLEIEKLRKRVKELESND